MTFSSCLPREIIYDYNFVSSSAVEYEILSYNQQTLFESRDKHRVWPFYKFIIYILMDFDKN